MSKARKTGFPCPKCGMRSSRVVRTSASDGYTLRRRCCKACGERFTTVERVPGGKLPADMQAIATGVGQLRKALDMLIPKFQ